MSAPVLINAIALAGSFDGYVKWEALAEAISALVTLRRAGQFCRPARVRRPLARVSRIMGSFGGYVKCYWCAYHAWNPYIIDWIGAPLCDWCFDWHLGQGYYAQHPAVLATTWTEEAWFGGPYEPAAVTRAARLLHKWLDERGSRRCVVPLGGGFPLEASKLVASFLVPWHAP